MRVGIVWENGVSKWMSQMFEPLKDIQGVDLTVFIGDRNKYDVSEVKLKKKMLTHREELLLGFSGLPYSLLRVMRAPFKRLDLYCNSLDRHLEQYDIVECPDSSRSLYTLAHLKEKKGFKLIVSYAENIPYRQVFDDKTNYIKHSTYGMINHFIPWCDTIKKVLMLEGVPEEKITTVYTGLDLNLFKPYEKDLELFKKYNIDEEEFIILYIGKLVSWKGVHILPYAARILLSNGYKKFSFLIAGGGAQMDNLKKVIAEAKIERHFRFTGFIPYMEIYKLYNFSDLFVCPSYPTMTWQEQFGMVLVEAMACGKPIVASASGSIPEIIDDAGLTFTPGDFFGLAEKISLFMAKRELLNEFGQKGRRRAENYFDAKKNALKIYDVYKKVMKD